MPTATISDPSAAPGERLSIAVSASPTRAQKQLAALPSVIITGAVDYQACDDKLCFNPARVPFSFTVHVRPLNRRPPGEAR